MAKRDPKSLKKRSINLSEPFFYHPQETLILAVVSALDVIMTYTLLTREDGGFIESNPFARYFLDRWGMAGMAYFKASMTLLVCMITQFVARKNSQLAQQVLGLATLIIVVVVIYSVRLHFQHHQISEMFEASLSTAVPQARVRIILRSLRRCSLGLATMWSTSLKFKFVSQISVPSIPNQE